MSVEKIRRLRELGDFLRNLVFYDNEECNYKVLRAAVDEIRSALLCCGLKLNLSEEASDDDDSV